MTVLPVFALGEEPSHFSPRAAPIAAMSEMAFRRVIWSVSDAVVCITLNMNNCSTTTLRLVSNCECSESS